MGAALAGLLAAGVSSIPVGRNRAVVCVAGLAALGGVLGTIFRSRLHPQLSIGATIGWLVGGTVLAAGVGWLATRDRHTAMRASFIGAALGLLFGGWGAADIGDGSAATSIGLLAVAGALLGAHAALGSPRDGHARGRFAETGRVWIFAGPAIGFTLFGLVIPLIRTTVVSLRDADAEDWVGFGNFQQIFTEEKSVNFDNWAGMFSARVFWIGFVLVAIGALVAWLGGRETGRRFEVSGSSLVPLVFGWFLLVCGVLANIRGTVFNTLWWVVTVTFVTTTLGMAVAVLADRARFERVAKSLIFMPMAISFVGAGIIWRFMYQAKNVSKPQNGVLNFLWVGVGEVTIDPVGKWVSVGVLAAIVVAVLAVAVVARRDRATTVFWGALALVVPFGYLMARVLSGGYGGQPGERAQEKAIDFINTPPYNNVWLMVILIWIQTGFAMVIFSAAIRAVPQELIEAARVDGATEAQIFWRVIIPQITPTIGVVVTTLILLVMKVFDIVSVTTNGNFDTQVLANDMWQRSFREGNRGLGSALAMVLFLSVLPVMIGNVRRMQHERSEEY